MAKKGKESKAPRSIQNRKARHDYAIQETVEAGIVLQGSEVKSLYLGRGHLNDSFCRVLNGEMWLINLDIEPYEQATVFAHERRRDRKLLLNRREIDVLDRKSLEKGLSLIPLSVYFNDKGRVKVEVGLGKGRAMYDKRDKLAKEDARREIERAKSEKF
ncbi:SsrA-binding protein SmpB [bacterium]|nr:MAG: SsrA-binding protein SmpB [bacterium]